MMSKMIMMSKNTRLIPLYKTTKYVFSENMFTIKDPVFINCDVKIIEKICNIIKHNEQPDNLVFDIETMCDDVTVKTEIYKLIEQKNEEQ